MLRVLDSVSLRFELSMLRGCVPDSVLRFEFSFMKWLEFRADSDHFSRVCYVVAFQIQFCYVSNLVS